MKNIIKHQKITAFLLLFALSFTTFNCSKSDSTTAVVPNSQVVGSWKFTSYFQKIGTAAETDATSTILLLLPCVKDVVFVVDSKSLSGTTAPKGCDLSAIIDIKSTYVINGTKLTITSSAGVNTVEDVSFSGSTMTWTSSSVSNNVTTINRIVFTKA